MRLPRPQTSISWIISVVLNILVLSLLAWLPKQIIDRTETALKVDLVRLPQRREPPPRVSARRPSMSISKPSRQATGRPATTSQPATSAVPVTTHARNIVPSANEPTLLSAETRLPDNLPTRLDAPVVQTSMQPGIQADRAEQGVVGTLPRSTGWMEELRGQVTEAPQAQVTGSGQGVTGYYDIATVQHEDAADAVRSNALVNLAVAMNHWTNVRTRFISGETPLADPQIHKIPLVFIAAQTPFAFSEKERANLRAYLKHGGTLVFSDVSTDWGDEGAVANSIRFELWQILGEEYALQVVRRGAPVCDSFFEFNGVPLVDASRGQFYSLRLAGRMAVFYDAAGLSLQWAKSDQDDKWLRWGVNLIVYALTNARS